VLLLEAPAQAHGGAEGGLLSGVLHPLLGTDHLLLLISVGLAAAGQGGSLLGWAAGGALLGAWAGLTALSLPAAELLAALSISLVALLALLPRAATAERSPSLGLGAGVLVGAGVAVHALLHGLEAPGVAAGGAAVWWLGALLASAAVACLSFLIGRRLQPAWRFAGALTLIVLGGVFGLRVLLA
jgi:urease accessory protein